MFPASLCSVLHVQVILYKIVLCSAGLCSKSFVFEAVFRSLVLMCLSALRSTAFDQQLLCLSATVCSSPCIQQLGIQQLCASALCSASSPVFSSFVFLLPFLPDSGQLKRMDSVLLPILSSIRLAPGCI